MGGRGVRDPWINFLRLQTLGEEACAEDDSLEGCWMVPKGWDEMRWDRSCFGAAMCSAMAWGSGPSINPWVVGGSETLGLISTGCRHWVQKHVPWMRAWRGAEWCRWDEMRWDCSCFGAAMCSAMAWGSGPSINPWVVRGSETLGLISTGCRHWVKKHVQRMTAWRGAEWCQRDEMRWDCSCFGADQYAER